MRWIRRILITPTTYLFFNGDCEKAFHFYEQTLGGTIEAMLKAADTPMAEHVGPEMQDNIIHARMSFGGGVIMASDCPPDRYVKPVGFCIHFNVESAEKAESIFLALQENGSVDMPMEKTFWAERFGALTNQFGTPWMVSCELV